MTLTHGNQFSRAAPENMRTCKEGTSGPPLQVFPVRRMSRYSERTLPLVLATPSAGMACMNAKAVSKKPPSKTEMQS